MNERIAVIDDSADNSAELARVAQLAEKLNCFIEEDAALIARSKLATLRAWRNRGEGPPYIRIGNRFLYPVKEFDIWAHGRQKAPPSSSGVRNAGVL